jgi:hypothetical protein
VRNRLKAIEGNAQICVILPWNAQRILEGMDAYPGHPSQSESAGGQIPRRVSPKATWETFRQTCATLTAEAGPNAVRICDGSRGVAAGGDPFLASAAQLAEVARKKLGGGDSSSQITPSLPDCWIWMSRAFFSSRGDRDPLTVEIGREELCKKIPDLMNGSRLEDELLKGHLRIITVSRARYNPRFRGRIVANPTAAKELLLHAGLCITASTPFQSPPKAPPPA